MAADCSIAGCLETGGYETKINSKEFVRLCKKHNAQINKIGVSEFAKIHTSFFYYLIDNGWLVQKDSKTLVFKKG